MSIDPILAVNNVSASARWYELVFGYRRKHGGDEFAILVDNKDQIMLCLHKWGAHEHPTMMNPQITPGNGLILYFRTENLEELRNNVARMKYPVATDMEVNPNSNKKEFSLRDLDGYYLTITEFHSYEG